MARRNDQGEKPENGNISFMLVPEKGLIPFSGILYSNGVAQDINSFGTGPTSFSWGMSDAGHVIMESGSPHWLIYHNNSVTVINDPTGTGGTIARAVNSAGGDVVGEHGDANFKNRAFLYHDGTYSDMPLLAAGAGNNAYGIGANGWVLGEADLPLGGGTLLTEAAVFHDGQVFDLNNLISPSDAQKYQLDQALAINSSGQILVNGRLLGGFDGSGFPSPEAYLLTPVPEPAALGLAFLAAPLLLRRRHDGATLG